MASRQPIQVASRQPIQVASHQPIQGASRQPIQMASRQPIQRVVRQPIKITVIGQPGKGKSSVLNHLAGCEDVFAEGAGAKSKTQTCSRKLVTLCTSSDIEFLADLGDTMGYPDTNKDNLVPYYDEVIGTIREPHHVVLWVVSNDRVDCVDYERVQFLFKNLQNLRCKIIMLVNGREMMNPMMSKTKKEEKTNEIRKAMTERGGVVDCYIRATGVEPAYVYGSVNREDLCEVCEKLKDRIYAITANAPAKASPGLVTVRELQSQKATMISTKNTAADDARDADEKVSRAENRYETLQSEIEYHRACADSDETNWGWNIWPIWWWTEAKYDRDAELRQLEEKKREAEQEAATLRDQRDRGVLQKQTIEQVQAKIDQATRDLEAINSALGV